MNGTNHTQYAELELQIERGSLFTHTMLTDLIKRINDNESFLYGLIDYLLYKRLLDTDELKKFVESVKKEMVEKKEVARMGAAIRVDNHQEDKTFIPVNCEERLHICKAACCRLSFALSVEEIEQGTIKWDLGKPYYNRHQPNGYCHHINNTNKCCTIYNNRPSVCKKYSCADDKRIWINFEQMELNEEWVETNLSDDKMKLIAMYIE